MKNKFLLRTLQRNFNIFGWFSLSIIALFIANPLSAQNLRLSKLFADHMVLQRDQSVKVWGWADQRTEIQLTFDQTPYITRTDQKGYWYITLPPLPAGGPHQLIVRSGGSEILVKNILMGDVWLCSGQSNMEWQVSNSNHAEQEIANASDQQIRHCHLPKHYSEQMEDTLVNAQWTVTSAETVGNFTAVGYFFAKELRKHHDVPIGLLNNAWGGSRIEAWMSPDMLGENEPAKAIEAAKEQARLHQQKQLAKLKAKFPTLSTQQNGIKKGIAVWAAPDLEEKDWHTISVPANWEEQGYEGFDGIAWYRTSFELNEAETKQDIKVHLAQIDDSDVTWMNGKRIGGRENSWNESRVYTVPAEILRPGNNVIAIRVEDHGGGGGIHGKPEQVFIKTSKRTIALAGNWKFKADAYITSQLGFRAHHTPTLLYNQLIHPITDFPIKGVIWYQGESNASTPKDAVAYQDQFMAMINGWRTQWAIGDFPFLYVQLANFMPPKPEPSQSNWALLRESQTKILQKIPNTAQAIIIDIGEADDIHPRNKQDVGHRLSLAARKLAYAEDLLYSSPTYKEHEIKNGAFIVTFDHGGKALEVRNKYGYVHGFAIAGEDKKFIWAKAKIKGNKIVIWNNSITNPKYLRYAWADNPDDVNVYNSAGLPLGPFRIE